MIGAPVGRALVAEISTGADVGWVDTIAGGVFGDDLEVAVFGDVFGDDLEVAVFGDVFGDDLEVAVFGVVFGDVFAVASGLDS